MKPSEAIRAKIQEKQEAIATLEEAAAEAARQVGHLKTEIAIWHEALILITTPMASEGVRHPEVVQREERHLPEAPAKKPGDFRRGPKGIWRRIMPEVLHGRRGKVFTLNDVQAAIDKLGEIVKPDTVRAQMSNYVTAGYLSRPKPGRFCFSKRGEEIFSGLAKETGDTSLGTNTLTAMMSQQSGVSPDASQAHPEASAPLEPGIVPVEKKEFEDTTISSGERAGLTA